TGTPITQTDREQHFHCVAPTRRSSDLNIDIGEPVRGFFRVGYTPADPSSLEPPPYFLLQTGTPIGQADGEQNFHWVAGDFNRDGVGDLIGSKVGKTGTGQVEADVLNGA